MHVADAQPGDTLRIDVLDVQVAEWGWSAILPGFGLLLDEYASPVLKIWTLHRNEGEGESETPCVGDGVGVGVGVGVGEGEGVEELVGAPEVL